MPALTPVARREPDNLSQQATRDLRPCEAQHGLPATPRPCLRRQGDRGEPAVSSGCFLRRTFAMKSARTSRCEVRAAAPQAPAAPPYAFFPWRNPALAGGRSAVPAAGPPPAGEVAARSADGGVSNLSRGQTPLHHAASRRGRPLRSGERGFLFLWTASTVSTRCQPRPRKYRRLAPGEDLGNPHRNAVILPPSSRK